MTLRSTIGWMKSKRTHPVRSASPAPKSLIPRPPGHPARPCSLAAVILVMGLTHGTRAFSQDAPVYEWTSFRQENGLAHNLVTSIAETEDGAIWFGTLGGGVSRYDGRSWRTFTQQDGLPSNAVDELYAGAEGDLWATTSGRPGENVPPRVSRMKGDRWEPVVLPMELPPGRVTHAADVGGGGICFSTNSGIVRYDRSEWFEVTEKDGLGSSLVRCVLRTRDGTLWAAHGGADRMMGQGGSFRGVRLPSPGGLSRFDAGSGRWEVFAEASPVLGETVLAMEQTTDGALWFGTASGGLLRYLDGQWHRFGEELLGSNVVLTLAASLDGDLWVGTPLGLVRHTPGAGGDTWRRFTETDGLPNNFVQAIHVQKNGVVWVGTRGGVARYDRTGWVLHDRWPGIRDPGPVLLASTRRGLMAMTRRAIYRYAEDRWQSDHVVADGEPGGWDADPNVGLAGSGDGAVWAATSRSLHFIRNDAAGWVDIGWAGQSTRNPILAIAPSARGGLWVGSLQGLFYAERERFTPVREGGPVSAVLESRDGSIWLGAQSGVVRVNGDVEEPFGPDRGFPVDRAVAFAEGGDGQVWASTLFEGVWRYDGEAWSPVPSRMETTLNGVRRILDTGDGTMWLASMAEGAIHTDGTVWARYTAQTGLPSGQVWDIAADSMGRLWFATPQGLGCYTPDGEEPETYLVAPPYQIPPGESAIFRFRGQDAWRATPEWGLQYSWRVDQEPWTPFSRETQAVVGTLPAGRTTFQVRAMDREFNVDATPCVHAFEVMAPLWLQPWFLAVVAASLIGLAVSTTAAIQRHRRWRTAQWELVQGLESELQQAHDLQMGLLPDGPIDGAGVRVVGRCVPANHVGGDFYSYRWQGAGQGVLGFGIADVSGKAMDAAVRVMQLSSVYPYEFRDGRDLVDVLDGFHRAMLTHMDETQFVTACLGTYDADSGTVMLANAAHPFPYHYTAADDRLMKLEMPSPPVGIRLPAGSNIPWGTCEVTLAAGDLLIFYSDGVMDLRDAGGHFFDEERFENLISDHGASGPDALVDAIMHDLAVYKGQTPQVDDVTLLVLHRKRVTV